MGNNIKSIIQKLKENPTDEELLEILSTFKQGDGEKIQSELSEKEIENINNRLEQILTSLLGSTGEDYFIPLEADLNEIIHMNIPSDEKIKYLEDYNQIEVLNRLLWTDEKINCLRCNEDQYYRVDSYDEGTIKYYTFMCHNCSDILDIGLNRRTNTIEKITSII